jgi:16S rRNA (guanine527-N7)-methyltransferase
MAPAEFLQALQGLDPDVSRETISALEAYAALLRKWQKAINLVSGATLEDVWRRHFLDSAQLLPLLASPEAGDGSITDLGSGAGFPGLVLAILSGRSTHLIESDQRKAAFLGEAARATGCTERVNIHCTRVEAAKPWITGTVTARAVADLSLLLDWAAPFVGPDTVLLFPKGAKADEELTAAERVWTIVTERRRSITDSTGLILRLSHPKRRVQT